MSTCASHMIAIYTTNTTTRAKKRDGSPLENARSSRFIKTLVFSKIASFDGYNELRTCVTLPLLVSTAGCAANPRDNAGMRTRDAKLEVSFTANVAMLDDAVDACWPPTRASLAKPLSRALREDDMVDEYLRVRGGAEEAKASLAAKTDWSLGGYRNLTWAHSSSSPLLEAVSSTC